MMWPTRFRTLCLHHGRTKLSDLGVIDWVSKKLTAGLLQIKAVGVRTEQRPIRPPKSESRVPQVKVLFKAEMENVGALADQKRVGRGAVKSVSRTLMTTVVQLSSWLAGNKEIG
jgi:hypothetical protein